MSTKAFFPSREGSNLILRTPAAVKCFSPNCQKMTFWHHWGGITGADTPNDAPMTGGIH